MSRPGFTGAWWPGEKGRVKNAVLSHDYHQICGTSVHWDPSLPAFFPFCHRNTVDPLHVGFCPPVKSQLKWGKSHKTNYTFLISLAEDFQCQRISIIVLGLGGKFPLMWLERRMRESDTGRWAFFISHSLLQLPYLCLLQIEKRKESSNWDANVFHVRGCNLAQAAARTENTKRKHGEVESSALLEHVLNDLYLKQNETTSLFQLLTKKRWDSGNNGYL